MDKTYYEILGIPKNAEPTQIKQAAQEKLNQLKKATTPANERKAQEQAQRIKEIFAVLGNPEKRKLYDAQLNTSQKKPISKSVDHNQKTSQQPEIVKKQPAPKTQKDISKVKNTTISKTTIPSKEKIPSEKSTDEVLISPLETEVIALKNAIRSGGRWFYWIAGLSIISSLVSWVVYLGNISYFVVGLGMTIIVDQIMFGLGIAVAVIFVVFGLFAVKGMKWAFIVGMILYALDAMLFLTYSDSDFMSVGFHCFVLFFLYRGLKACFTLSKLVSQESNKAVV